jgi:hypothetical protein
VSESGRGAARGATGHGRPAAEAPHFQRSAQAGVSAAGMSGGMICSVQMILPFAV